MGRVKQTARKNAAAGGAAAAGAKKRKPHRFKPGTVAMREIVRYQKSTAHVLPRQPMERLIRETLAYVQGGSDKVERMKADAIEALHEASEMYLSELFSDTMVAAANSLRTTVFGRDMKTVLLLQRRQVASNAMHGAPLVVEVPRPSGEKKPKTKKKKTAAVGVKRKSKKKKSKSVAEEEQEEEDPQAQQEEEDEDDDEPIE